MGLYHAHRENLVEVEKPKDNDSLVIEAVDEEPDVVEAQRNWFGYVIGVLIHILQELLDVWVSAVIEVRIIDIYDHIFKVVFFLLPLQVRLEFWQRKCFEKDLDAQVFEIIWLQLLKERK